MRKKIILLFYTLASLLILLHLGSRFMAMSTLQSSSKPLYMITLSEEAAVDEEDDAPEIDYQQWAQKYEEQTQ